MAVKTTNLEIDLDSITTGSTLDANKKNALSFLGKTYEDLSGMTASTVDKNLILSYSDKTITVKNYTGIKYFVTTDKVTDIISNGFITNNVNFNQSLNIKNGVVNDLSKYSDIISANSLTKPIKVIKDKQGNITSKIGVTIKSGDGYDTITGSSFNDKITGGKGVNTINYTASNFGDDIINLTKGETLNITGLDFTNIDADKRFIQGSNKNDLLVITKYGTITLKNYLTKELGATVTITSTTPNETINLSNDGKMEVIGVSNYFAITGQKVKAKYTGTALADRVYGANLETPTAVKKIKGEEVKIGVTVNTNAGNDVITGSKFNDTITAGTGQNTIDYTDFESEFGDDIINLTKGETLNITGLDFTDIDADKKFTQGSNKNDLLVTTKYGTITLKNYLTKNLGAEVIVNGTNLNKIPLSINTSTVTSEGVFKNGKFQKATALADSVDASGLTTAIKTTKDKKGNIISETGVTINTGFGDDKITGSKFNDTITGGVGTNTIIIKNETFGTDTINLTKDENLILDLSAYTTITSADDLKEKVKVNGANLEINLGNGTIILKKYGKSDVTGSNGSVKVKLSNSLEVDLSTADILTYDSSSFKNGKFAGSRFGETIDATNVYRNANISGGAGYNNITGTNGFNDVITGGNDGNKIAAGNGNKTITTGSGNDIISVTGSGTHTVKTGNGINTVTISGSGKTTVTGGTEADTILIGQNSDVTNINAGNGRNNITVSNSGNNTIVTGVDDDTITINGNTSTTNIKAGAGENTINIYNASTFGNIILNEEKVNAKNIINFATNIDNNYTLIKSDNDLIISKGTNSKVTINGYFIERGDKTKYADIEFQINGTETTVDSLLSLTEKGLTIGGSGTITGTENADNILANDYDENIKASNDIITAGKGNDTINAGRGKNTIKFNVGDGADIIQDGGGTDTLVFDNNVSVSASYNGNDLVISYGDKCDTVTLQDYANGHSVKNIQIGNNRAKSIDTYLPQPKTLKVGDYNIIQGTDNADIINASLISTNQFNIPRYKIFGGGGNDTLKGNNGNDYLYGGAGDDVIIGGTGNDTLFGGSGSNKFYFNTGDGQDFFYEDGVDNTLIFNNISSINNLTFSLFEYGMGNYSNYDLIIKYSKNGTVTIKNFLSQPDSSSGYVYDFSGYKIQAGANRTPISLLEIVNSIDSIKKTITINDSYKSNPKSHSTGEAQLGNQLDNMIIGRTASDGADTTKTQYIFGMDGKDTITANGSDVDAGSGDDIIAYDTASTYVYGGSGNDILNANGSFGYGGDGDDEFYGIGSMSGDRGDDKFYLQGSSNPTDETQSSRQFNVITGSGNDYVDATRVTSLYDGDMINITTGEGVNTLHLDGNKAVNIVLGLAETYRDISTNNSIEYQKMIESNMYNYNFNIYYTAYEKDGDLIIVSNRGGEQVEEYDNSTHSTVKNDGIGAGITIIKGYSSLSSEQKSNIKITFLPSNPYVNNSYVYPYKEGGAIMETYSLPEFLNNIVNNTDAISTTLEEWKDSKTYTTKWFNKIDNTSANNTTVAGTDNADYILGGASAQTINGGAGNDVIYTNDFGSHDSEGNYIEAQKEIQTTINGEGGNDYIIGSTGVDVINGGTGRDYIHGGSGNDTLIGGSIETFEGATSNALMKYDEIHGGDGDDTIYSVNETQSYQGGETYYRNFLYGEEGDDTIYANGYADQVYGGEGDDTIYSYAQKYHQDSWDRDTNLFGGSGDDKIYIKSTVGVYADGGEGNDLINASESTGNYNRLEGGSGNDTINGGSGSSEIVGGMGDDIIYGGDGDEEIYGGVMTQAKQAFESDTIHAGKGSDIIYAGGSSKIYGDEGSNTIYFGTGSANEASNLYITGGTGNDTYIYHGYNGIDTIVASDGNDVIKFANFSSAKTEQFENNLAIEYMNTSNITNVLILKDYFLSQNSFDNFSIATYNSDDVSGTGTEYTVAAFINNYQ